MTSAHKHQTSYGETKDLYKYTDCINNDYNHISSFYSGKELTGNWDGAATWNREHTWPNSKGLGGNDENDIMMLRPTWVQENSSRGNTAYGEGSSYYHPNSESNGNYDLRGDVARICLYVYVRWGNTSRMWGSSGVMESKTVLLKWMEEDPVDTWEMGRNDAVQSITGTRNVFVDYPEYAFLLFGAEIPSDMVTPSGEASEGACDHSWNNADCDTPQTCSKCGKINGSALGHAWDSGKITTNVTCTVNGVKLFTCTRCGTTQNTTIAATGHKWSDWVIDKEVTATENGSKHRDCATCGSTETVVIEYNHTHSYTSVVTKPTCTAQGYTTHTCACGDYYIDTYTNVKNHTYSNGICTMCGAAAPTTPVGTKDDFTKIIAGLAAGIYSGQTKFEKISEAVRIYDSLSQADKDSLSGNYKMLKDYAMEYNDEIITVTNDSRIFGQGNLAVVVMSAVPFAAYSLLKKKEF